MGLLDFTSRLGKKVASGIHSVARIGKKITGEVARVGHKIADVGKHAVSMVERVPIIGTALAPATGIARSALGMVENIADGAGTANKLISAGDDVVSRGQSMLEGKSKADLGGLVKDASKIASDTKGLGGSIMSNVKDARDMMRRNNPNNP